MKYTKEGLIDEVKMIVSLFDKTNDSIQKALDCGSEKYSLNNISMVLALIGMHMVMLDSKVDVFRDVVTLAQEDSVVKSQLNKNVEE